MCALAFRTSGSSCGSRWSLTWTAWAARAAPGAARTIQTSFESPYDDRLDPDDDRLVYRYRGTDPAHPDNVALRRAMELRRPLLYLVAVDPGLYQAVFPCYVVGDDPGQLAFFLVTDARRDILAASEEDPLASAPLKAYATRMVKQRLHQERFRYLILAGPMLRHGLQEMHGQLIGVPRRVEHRPNRDYLAERFSRFRAA